MSRIPSLPQVFKSGSMTSDPPSRTEVKKAINDIYTSLAKAVNNISLGGPNGNMGNVNCTHVTGTFVNANTNTTFAHNLGRIPTGFVVVSKSLQGDIWNGTIAWTISEITLQSSVANQQVTLLIY